jgi:homoserine O-acetyltransferase
MLKGCRVGYRTFGKLNERKDNTILFPTWYLGTSGDLAGNFRAGGLVDPAKYFVIAVDALSNGVSTSPSNSKTQHDAAFPAVTIRDMVESQHQMLLHLGIRHLHAVMGISMGGMQTFQWVTAYPDFMDKAVPIVGSPQPTSYDLMFYGSSLKTLRAAIKNKSAREDLIRAYADPFWLALESPSYFVKHTERSDAAKNFEGFESNLLKWDPYDMAAGTSALLTNDVYKAFGGDKAKAAGSIRAKLLVISAAQDHCVNPAPALALAGAIGAETLLLPDDEGHQSPGAEAAKVAAVVERFLGGS